MKAIKINNNGFAMDEIWQTGKIFLSWLALGLTSISNFYVEYASNLMTMLTGIAAFWLMVVLIRLRTIDREAKKQEMKLRDLEIAKAMKDKEDK